MPEKPTTPTEIVQNYAEAKSRADIAAALQYCHPDVVFETVPFQAVAKGTEEAARQFTGFFRAFPDYDVEVEYIHEGDAMVFAAGTIRATMKGSLAGIDPTGKAYALPFACHWNVRDGLITHERFFFDFHQMCEQLGLSTDAAAASFQAWRDLAQATAVR